MARAGCYTAQRRCWLGWRGEGEKGKMGWKERGREDERR